MNEFVSDNNRDIGFKWVDIVGCYYMGCNHGPKEEKHANNSTDANQMGNLQHKLKKGNGITSKEVWR